VVGFGPAEPIMAYTIHASKDCLIVQTLRIGARVAAEKAWALFDQGWDVRITDQAGQRYSFDSREGLELRTPDEVP
jgi:hypothetical protein